MVEPVLGQDRTEVARKSAQCCTKSEPPMNQGRTKVEPWLHHGKKKVMNESRTTVGPKSDTVRGPWCTDHGSWTVGRDSLPQLCMEIAEKTRAWAIDRDAWAVEIEYWLVDHGSWIVACVAWAVEVSSLTSGS